MKRSPSSAKFLLHKLRFALVGCALVWLSGAGAAPGAEPVINVWYGLEQSFGKLGNPQPRINILGSVARAEDIDALSFSLNGGPAMPLSMGVDLRRLARPGDFNIEIERSDLRDGMNEVMIKAALRDGGAISTTVRIHFTPDRGWPLPYQIDWSKVERIQDVAEVMDGLWKLTPQGVRTVEPYYDRVIAIGDMQWTDYEVLTSVIFHKMLADEIAPRGPPYSNHAHASVLLRWRGHDNDGKQPRVKWHPTGGLAMFRANAGSEGNQWIWHGGESGFLAQEAHTRPVEIGSRYYIKARVETLPGPKTRYSVKAWKAGEEEPAVWDLVGIDGERDSQSGSLLLVVHHSDVTFGNVEVRGVAPPGP
ncbi:MAG: hypothetical protein A3G75_10735 [Verrucomicrobia bacterium RIFCSPLOWO2_12_FULL_64_8]|nr:MAG: hypothetical protein A3G75_10735 [Verrucomicrobia bacterium RIFCSPLOWO2_12_FULL_64_8]